MHRPRLTWRLLRLHLTLASLLVAFALLADWQWHRALAGNRLSWAYAFEWPLFAVYAIVLWRRLVLDELGTPPRRRARHDHRARRGARAAARAHDEEVARLRYNEYLASLGRDDRAPPERRELGTSD